MKLVMYLGMDAKHVSSIKIICFQGKYKTIIHVNENIPSEHDRLIFHDHLKTSRLYSTVSKVRHMFMFFRAGILSSHELPRIFY